MDWGWVPIVAVLVSVGGFILSAIRAGRTAQQAEFAAVHVRLEAIQEQVTQINGTVRQHTASIIKVETLMEERLRVDEVKGG